MSGFIKAGVGVAAHVADSLKQRESSPCIVASLQHSDPLLTLSMCTFPGRKKDGLQCSTRRMQFVLFNRASFFCLLLIRSNTGSLEFVHCIE